MRVTRDQAIVWAPSFLSIAAVVKAGTELEAISRFGTWYEVVLPAGAGRGITTGMIAINQVEIVRGAPPPPRSPQTPGQRLPGTPPVPRAAQRIARNGARGFGTLGYGWFQAHRSFDAVFGQPGGLIFGGGGEFRVAQLLIHGSIEQFRRTGTRVFVFDGEVFKLGIPNKVTVTPLMFTVGYRFNNRLAAPYLGGGAGRYFFRESSRVADESDKVTDQFNSYHAMGGYEWRTARGLATALEVQYTYVPDALRSEVSTAFNEHNLGGIQARVKILFGR